MVLAAAEPKKDMLLIGRNVRWLEQHQIKEGERKGAWSYPGPGGDNSNAQFAVLALYDAQRVGAKVSRETWELAADYWRAHAERRRLLGLRSRRLRHRQHDVRRHRRPGHLLGRARIGRCRRGKRPRHLLPARTRTITNSTWHQLARRRFSVTRNPRAGGGQSALVLLSLRLGARRPAHGAALHRRARLVSRRCRVPGPRAGFALALLERQLACRARPAHQHGDGAVVSLQGPPADRHGQDRSTARATTGTSTAAMPPISPPTPKRPGSSA